MLLPAKLLHNRKLESLVENQTTYVSRSAEMHIFETHQEAEQILLKFHQPVLASMLQGKKVMHLNEMNSFDFLPGESLMLPAGEQMCIDFPEAKIDNPTRCLAMTIADDKIQNTITLLNETMPKADGKEWMFTDYNFHFTNDVAIHQIIQRLLFIFAENHASKDMFADLMLQELIVRILQTENRKIYTEQSLSINENNRLSFVIEYIRENLDKSLTVEELSNKVYMSESNFHRVFKNELGISPIDYINNERIKLATSLLHNPRKKIKDIYMECGFNSLSYFNRLFKRKKQLSPKAFQKQVTSKDFNRAY